MSDPLVTAIMVTGKYQQRYPLACASVRSFLAQTYQNRELVIVNDGKTLVLPEGHGLEGVREYMIPKGKSLGELRNYGLERANGKWITQWDDDDWHHEDRIKTQMRARVAGGAVLFRYQVRYSFLSKSAYVFRWNFPSVPGISGTVLHQSSPRARYRDESKEEDDHFLQDHFKGSIVVIDNKKFPHWYLRFYHGSNTWDERHVMGDIGPQQWRLPPKAERYLRDVLRREYQS